MTTNVGATTPDVIQTRAQPFVGVVLQGVCRRCGAQTQGRATVRPWAAACTAAAGSVGPGRRVGTAAPSAACVFSPNGWPRCVVPVVEPLWLAAVRP